MKLVVPPFVMVPLLVRVPAIFKVPAIEVVTVAPELMVTLLQDTLLVIEGILVAVEVIVTLVEEVGTTPEHQLLPSAQSVLTLPVHTPALVVGEIIV